MRSAALPSASGRWQLQVQVDGGIFGGPAGLQLSSRRFPAFWLSLGFGTAGCQAGRLATTGNAGYTSQEEVTKEVEITHSARTLARWSCVDQDCKTGLPLSGIKRVVST